MHLNLINSTKKVKVCRKGFAYLKKQGLDKGWRLHSAGYAVYQFTRFGRINTLYLHKLLAEQFLQTPSTEKKLFVRMINGNKLDCQLDNIEYTTMAELRREQSTTTGFRGVSKDGNKFRAVIYDKGERIYLGMYSTAEEAAKAYDEESFKRFGLTKSLNYRAKYESMDV
ncbi:AP2 domain-containing protein [Chondrinema litorale]|uniref:AP2 domain-containing protein n=1 Tax=Chondrinema litorale TaxID=2994555 RepID=UPI0025427DE1|nr:AP2 domain-containing protein [Chondrinema litorale]UZR93955.1 AP2 domain-containing protein [Chondrinema litorale]